MFFMIYIISGALAFLVQNMSGTVVDHMQNKISENCCINIIIECLKICSSTPNYDCAKVCEWALVALEKIMRDHDLNRGSFLLEKGKYKFLLIVRTMGKHRKIMQFGQQNNVFG